ncbi:hypothetical protein FE257_005939 [Aspergillus nanangensis]|uniref:Beta-lactamase-related domain-containing protein n=1 Tax=Aspergillus nanangensis TaxID=2582783 RepID=A0AAD4GUE5_ASPNN|nr:hypothetical protein FE257_005939 [Aspergillus nanangensis]
MKVNRLEEKVRRLTSEDAGVESRIPGLVLMSQTRHAPENVLSVAHDSVDENTVFWIASVTKIMTTVGALMCVERGLIELDSVVTVVLPELRQLRVLEGFGADEIFKLADRDGPITLRQLLTHSSGIGYDILNPDLLQCRAGIPKSLCGKLDTAFFDLPLVYQPGASWQYGAGIEWAGILIERLNGNVRLGKFLEENIWIPLGIESTTFHLEDRPDLTHRLATLSNRTADEILTVDSPPLYPHPARDDSGGAGAYSTPADVMKFLQAILTADPRLLRSQSFEEMFQPQLADPTHLKKSLQNPLYQVGMACALPDGTPMNFGLGGLLSLSDLDMGRKAGSMQWGGYPNLGWWIDRVGGLCGFYCSQLIPACDQVSMDLKWDFERAMYA